MREPMNAVIYARYSSHSQTEQSIEGQLADGYSFAERCGYRVVGEYIDRALTGTKDDRPDFQRMIQDAEKKLFSVVIVWKLDRFARNRYDSAIYKRQLKKFGVRVVSVMENITDSPEGIILEGLLEAMAEYYSANLSENIRRGQQESLKKKNFPGGIVPYGYKIVDQKLVIDDQTAPVVREIYERYADGEGLKAIADDLNKRGYRARKGHPFKVTTFDAMVPNEIYLGIFHYGAAVVEDMCEPILTKDLFDKAVARRKMNARAPARKLAKMDYLLSGKIFCGLCGLPMVGDCGRSRNGEYHHYYSCSGRKERKNKCRKISDKQDFMEWFVCEQTMEYILLPSRLDFVAQRIVDLYNADIDDSREKDLERVIQRLKDESSALIDKLTYAPKKAAVPIMEKMEQLELQRADVEMDLQKLRAQQKIPVSKKEVSAWLSAISHGDPMDPAFRRQIIDTFINCVYVYDDKVVIFYNIKNGQLTVGFDELPDPDRLCSSLSGESGA